MPRRHAGIIRPPNRMHVKERIGMTVDEGSRAPDQTLADGDDEARQCDGHEHEGDAHRARGEHHPGKLGKRGRSQHRDCQQKHSAWPKEPARFSEVGHLLEQDMKPLRRSPHRLSYPGVEQNHRRRDRSGSRHHNAQETAAHAPARECLAAQRPRSRGDGPREIGNSSLPPGLHPWLRIVSAGHAHCESPER